MHPNLPAITKPSQMGAIAVHCPAHAPNPLLSPSILVVAPAVGASFHGGGTHTCPRVPQPGAAMSWGVEGNPAPCSLPCMARQLGSAAITGGRGVPSSSLQQGRPGLGSRAWDGGLCSLISPHSPPAKLPGACRVQAGDYMQRLS